MNVQIDSSGCVSAGTGYGTYWPPVPQITPPLFVRFEFNGGKSVCVQHTDMSMSGRSRDSMGYWGAVSIGVGGMVGGGIFAVLGLAVQLAHGGTPIAFLIAGAITLLTAYSYAKLSVAWPSLSWAGPGSC